MKKTVTYTLDSDKPLPLTKKQKARSDPVFFRNATQAGEFKR